jgi:glyoxylase-like metal-dependent hydrolase (beta-lactamase superfamily II)
VGAVTQRLLKPGGLPGYSDEENLPLYQVYAVKYATREARSPEHFHGGDPHDGPMPMDYFVWAAVSAEHTVVVDAGFSAEVAEKRQRTHLRCPTDGLAALGINCARLPLVVLTHLHYDHVGNLEKFPAADFVVQDDEMAFWTGRYASKGHFRHIVEVEDIVHLVRENFAGRLRFVAGTREIVPGITVHRVGGHAAGLQVVRANTARGNIVLASDATHYYANIEGDRPYSVVKDLAEMYEAFEIVRWLADSPEHVVPGHDPLVMERFPAVSGELDGVAARIA